jgi:hypothetical protein
MHSIDRIIEQIEQLSLLIFDQKVEVSFLKQEGD